MTPAGFDPIEHALPAEVADAILDTAIGAAKSAGAIQMRHFRTPGVRATGLLHDVKLETDRACEAAILAILRARFPDHAVLTEESGRLPGAGECTWVIDPLDGTVNFWQGLPFFCTSIACYRTLDGTSARPAGGLPGLPVAGVVYLPFSRELFHARPGRGAFLNGRPVRIPPAGNPAEAVVSVSFGKRPETMRRMAQRLERMLPRVRKARCLGAAAAELAYVAAGFLNGLFYEGLKVWDFAAGKIILEEAGGLFEAAETEPDQWRVLAGGSAVIEMMHAPH
jgi:fructose-1,6-bisphosphatase/inositol monophosphatase family enzyme